MISTSGLRFTLGVVLFGVLGGCGECEDDYACPSNQICNTETARCEDYVCRQDAECAAGYRCQSNQCQVQVPKTPPDAVDPLPAGKLPVGKMLEGVENADYSSQWTD